MRSVWAFSCRTLLVLAMGILTVDAVVAAMLFPVVGIVVLAGLGWRLMRRGWSVSDSYGSATFAGPDDLRRGKLASDTGIILGRTGFMPPPTRIQAVRSLLSPLMSSEAACRQFLAAFGGKRWAGNGFIRTNDFTHLGTFSPAGGGKSVSSIIVTLLSYMGSTLVIDPKGEFYKLTAKHRRKMGHRVVRIDPALLCGPGADTFNPFDWIDPHAKDFIDRCRDLAAMMVVRTGKEQDQHFNDSAENVIAAFIAYICACEPDTKLRHLRGMRTGLASRENYQYALERMQEIAGFHGVLEQLGHSLTWHVDKELGSVMTTAQRHTKIFDSPLIADSTSSSSFDPATMRTGRKTTIYVVCPPQNLQVWAAWQRMVLGSIIRIITRGVPTEKNPVLCIIDECANIGQMAALEEAVTLLRGAGIRMWLFFQSIEQLKKCFGDNAGTVLDNLATQQYYSINSYDTAEAISKRIGDTTIAIRTEGGNSGTSTGTSTGKDSSHQGGRNSGTSYNVSETTRRLLKPEEILTLADNTSLVFHKNLPVIFAERIKYYSDRAFRQRGILRRYGTGKSRGLGLGGMVLSLAALLLAGVVTAFVANLPTGNQQHPLSFLTGTSEPEPFGVYGGNDPSPYPPDPWRQPSPFVPGP